MYHFDWVRRHAERTPYKLALVDGHTRREITYAQLDERASRFAVYLLGLGMEQGDRISILAQNSAEYYEILLACGKIGVILNTLNWRLTAPELSYILHDCQPRLLIYEAAFAENVQALSIQAPVEHHLLLEPGGTADAPSHLGTYEGAIAASPINELPEVRMRLEDTWAIIYTSGTTGHPKGAQVTYGNFFYNAIGIGQALDLTSQDVNLNVLPTFHIGGLGLFACPTLHAGGTVVVMRSFEPAAFLQLVQGHRVSLAFLVPSIFLMLEQFPDFDRYDLSSMRSWGSGGSALPPSLVRSFAKRGIVIQQGFGMTETGPSVFYIARDDAVRKAGSVGRPVLHTEVRIQDHGGKILGANEVGELCVRGGNVINSYWNKPEATAEAIVDGWLHTGDAAMYDEEGFYYIVDRWKDMFISGGENVYPAEVENVIYQHPAVAEVAVIGVPHPRWQEVGRAVVVVKAGHSLSEQEVIDFCQDKLARYKIPKSAVFVQALPRTGAGKVLKRELRQKFGDG